MSPLARIRVPRPLARALSNRLVQFGLIAGALFAVAPRAENPSRIELHHAALDKLDAAAAQRSGLVVLPAEQAQAVERRAIEDEVLYREGLRLGLDQGDGIIRQRVIQRVLFFAEEIADASRPATETELRAYYDAHRAELALPARVRLQHVFAETEAALPPRPQDAEGTPGHPLALGKPGPVPAEVVADERKLTDALGADFARAVLALPEGRWQGPIRSAFGAHFVKVLAREGSRIPPFEEARRRVIEDESIDRKRRATADFIAKAFARYDVSLDGAPVREPPKPTRVAMRAFASGED